LDVSDRISLTLDGAAELLDAARAHQDYIAGETLALAVAYGALADVGSVMVDGLELRVGVVRAGS
jgi:isoleucyl-tRNA synthetase